MATVRLGDVTLDWSETGAGAPVVLIHGSASDTRTWNAQADALAAHWRVIGYSRRYHWPNEPPGPETDYDMSVHVDDLLRLLEALELPPAHLVGHSYGAYVALMAALKRPAHVASLVLAEPPVVPLLIGNPPRPARLLGLLATRPRSGWAIARFVATGLDPAASHNMHEANPATFNALVADFLAARKRAEADAAPAALSPGPGAG